MITLAEGTRPLYFLRLGCFDLDTDFFGLVMRCGMGGGTLHALLHPDSRSPLEDKLRYMRDLAACVADMHRLGWYH
jgi:hypothetical protein